MRKSAISFLLIFILSVCTLFIVACGEPAKATVKFTYKDKDADVAAVIETITVNIDETVVKPEDPISPKQGYRIAWYNNDEEWNFDNDKVTEDLTLRAVEVPIIYSISYKLYGAEKGNNPNNYTVRDRVVLERAGDKPATETELADLQAQYEGIMDIQSAVYVFIGWRYYGTDTEPVPDLVIDYGTTGDIVLEACFNSDLTYFGTAID